MIKQLGSTFLNFLTRPLQRKMETSLLALGSILSNQQRHINTNAINDYEFKIFSQRGEDGIIQYLIKNVQIENEIFVEFGVENYMESNTRFLMMHNNWSGLVMDGSDEAIKSIRKREWFWGYELQAKCAFINKDNINRLLTESGFKNIGLLSIDIDGNDYWIFKEIDFSELNPSIVIVKYNALFGNERTISVPYDKDFNRTKAHYSNLFFGASLAALDYIAQQKGYALVGCNTAGSNAFFVRNDLLNDKVSKKSVIDAYREEKFRQSRDKNYKLSLLSGNEKIDIIKNLDVINVVTNEVEKVSMVDYVDIADFGKATNADPKRYDWVVSEKIITQENLSFVLNNLRHENKKIVFTNGVFDIIHRGHISYLQKARQLGDILILGLNTDASVKRIKGEGRPINHENDRAFVLSAIEFVDYIIMFSEDTPYNLLKAVQPDVLVKGADYKIEDVVGKEFATETILINFEEGYSSTNIINQAFT